MTNVTKDSESKHVEICEDMACVIYNEVGYDIADYLSFNAGFSSKDVKGKLFLVEEEHRYSHTKWWILELSNAGIQNRECDKF